jgi:hypothetical protein
MSTALELVYQYRQLLGKCESWAGLELDEIDALGAIEALFTQVPTDEPPGAPQRRQHLRQAVDIPAFLRGPHASAAVHVSDLGPGGLVCRGAPFVAKGSRVEIIFDDPELGLSYRFKAQVTWRSADGGNAAAGNENYRMGLHFVGAPLLMRRGRSSGVEATDAEADPVAQLERLAASVAA